MGKPPFKASKRSKASLLLKDSLPSTVLANSAGTLLSWLERVQLLVLTRPAVVWYVHTSSSLKSFQGMFSGRSIKT